MDRIKDRVKGLQQEVDRLGRTGSSGFMLTESSLSSVASSGINHGQVDDASKRHNYIIDTRVVRLEGSCQQFETISRLLSESMIKNDKK